VPRYELTAFGRSAALAIGWAFTAATAGCTHTLVFSDKEPIAVIGYPPPPPPPPAPPKPPAPPPPTPKRVEVQDDRIAIHDKILFETDKAIIRPESFGLLEEIIAVINTNPQILRISIEGHTDSTGSDQHNQQLSDARAHSVLTYLVEHGVAPERLTSKGWGEKKPIAPNTNAFGREQNRRVEFLIVEQTVVNRTYEIDPKTGERREVGTPKPAGDAGVTP